jgi:hypothetical protein
VTAQTQALLSDALQLTVDERAELAAELLACRNAADFAGTLTIARYLPRMPTATMNWSRAGARTRQSPELPSRMTSSGRVSSRGRE